MIAADPTWKGLLRGLLVLAVIWWAWAAYAWLTNTLDADEGRTRVVVFVSMAAMFVVALSIPRAFNDLALLFAVAYFVVRAAHILLYGYGANDVGVKEAVMRLAPPSFVGCGLLVAASALDGVGQGAMWRWRSRSTTWARYSRGWRAGRSAPPPSWSGTA